MPVFFRNRRCNAFFFVFILLCCQTVSAQSNFVKMDEILESRKRELGGDVCMLVYKDGKIIYEHSMGDYNRNRSEMIASCSKWLTAALVMTFVDEGKLSIEDPVAKYLPEFSKGAYSAIRIKHCLSHTTGIQTEPITLRSLLQKRKYKTLADEVKDFSRKPVTGEPGKVFAYGTIGLNIAGRVLEVISGKDFNTLFRERIALPLGMNSTTFPDDKHGCDPSGGAVSTASDYMNFLIMILNNGSFGGKQIISRQSVEMMQESRTAGAVIEYTPEDTNGAEYGFGEWIQQKDETGKSSVVSSPGLFGTFPFIDKKRNYAAILFVKTLRRSNRREINLLIKRTLDEVIDSGVSN